jgi:hypothetical protein
VLSGRDDLNVIDEKNKEVLKRKKKMMPKVSF